MCIFEGNETKHVCENQSYFLSFMLI